MTKEEIFQKAIEQWGVDSQVAMMLEEMSELQNALMKLTRGRDTEDHVCEEIADVMVMCEQLAIIFGKDKVSEYFEEKVNRLEGRLC